MDEIILQDRLFDAPWGDPSFRRLPGMRPVGPDDWLLVDEVYGLQMALRDRFLASRREEVVALLPEAREAAAEVLDLTLATLGRRADFEVSAKSVRRPDGVEVPVRPEDPLGTVGRLLQEDVCLLQRREDEHVLTGAVLIFPSGWTLSQKIGRPLLRIHLPVPVYLDDVAKRVQRLFDGLKPGRPLMRANLLWHRHAALHAPRREGEPKPSSPGGADYLRSERQCLVRLPSTGAVIFTIHTTVVETARLSPEMRAAVGRRPD
jgi:dimethylamine monooxygenase subunit A